MIYDHILIRYGELALKGQNRKFFINKLHANLNYQLKEFENVKIKKTQGRMFILLNGHDPDPIIEKCQHIFGIHSLSLAIKAENDLQSIQEAALFALTNSEQVKTFKVSVRRTNKAFPISSQEMNHKVGAFLLKNTDQYKVDVHHPDLEIKIEIREKATYITSSVIQGPGGLPVGTSGKTLLLLSGGIDSPVAGYLMLKRGVQLEAIHFHSPPFTSERAKQKVLDLAEQLAVYGKKIKVHMVPFTKIQQTIFQKMPERYGMTIMRRIMLQISEQVCQKESILSMTTGESLGQVASQTMESMNAINEVTNLPVIRPLVAMDKVEIIKIAKDIKTYDISVRPYEDCCTIFVPKSPATRPKRDKVKAIHAQYDFSPLIEEAIQGIETIVVEQSQTSSPVFDNLL